MVKTVPKPIILRIVVILAVVAVISTGLFFLPKHVFPNLSYWDSTDSIEPNSAERVNLGYVSRGHFFVGKATLWKGGWGGEPAILGVGIQDSSGNTVLASTLVYESFSFEFEAPKDDFYYFYFDNSYSVVPFSNEGKVVFWQVFYYGPYTLIFQILASVLWASEFIFISFYCIKKEKEPERREQSIPVLADEIIEKIVRGRE
jgi:hypothetical protein